ncbi:MAG: SpoIIE family protein phosphatase [Lachnospiraceae bacterium]|nr:SpoIIE family protein phosphatase [Lachnospiraceae bacterium]
MSGWPQPEREQIRQYADAFYGLAGLFQKLPCQKERLAEDELQGLFEEVKERTCVGCQRADDCWQDAYLVSCRRLYEMLLEMERNGTFSAGQKQFLEENCERSDRLELALRTGYEEARVNLLWSNRMLEQRKATGEQIFQTAELLKRTADGFAYSPLMDAQIARRLRRELKFLHTELDLIRAFARENGKYEVYLVLHTRRRPLTSTGVMGYGGFHHAFPGRGVGQYTAVSARSVAEALSECCGERMCPAYDCQGAVTEEPMLFHFVPEPNYQLFCGIARITKDGEMVSGDNYALLQKDTGTVVMSLADGMGSGVEANRESGQVMDLLEQFLEAGVPQENVVRLGNSCMLLQDDGQMFSTIDLCMVDLYNAKCDMIKSGAAASFIRRDGEIEVIRSRTFPAGVVLRTDYESMHRQLESGASIVMMTDGVLDALPEENREQAMAELIVRTMTRNAEEYARRLMESVYRMQQLQAKDDMTILVGTIFEK